MKKTRKKEIKKERRKNLAASDASCSTVDFLLIRVIYLMRKKRERKKERRATKRIKNKINELLLYTIQYNTQYDTHSILYKLHTLQPP